VSLTVRAFMNAELPNELIELLDKIVLGPGSQFANEKSLQNLLILTAVKADKGRVMEYINRLDNFDSKEVAGIALDEELFEEAFALYRKTNDNESAINVLLDHIKDLARGLEFAQRCDDSAVWSLLATGQLRAAMVKEAVDSFCKAKDPMSFQEVIQAATTYDAYDALVTYLTMARTKTKDQIIDTELVYAYCKTGQLVEIENFIGGPNVAQIQQLGDRCFDEAMYEPAKLLFTQISNYARLATTLSKLSDFTAAVDAARKANSSRTWREVCQSCVAAEEFRLAQVCGLHIIVQPDELEDLIEHYEKLGHIEELQTLLEAGLGLERAHMGIFTELGALYAKYNEEKLFEHIKIFWARINIPKLVRVCEVCEHWSEQCFLYIKYDEYDNAATVMMNHVEAWTHQQFMDVINKAANVENYYRAVDFYLEHQPMVLNELLLALISKVEHGRVVSHVTRTGHLALIKPYLLQVQTFNVTTVNDALNEMLMEEEAWEELRESVDNFDNFDQIGLATRLFKNECLEFRRISSYLYKKNGRFEESIQLSKQDKLYKDAMDTAAQSQDVKLVDDLISFFVAEGEKECFAACLFTCYDLVRPDAVLELAWRQGLTDFAMPYVIQFVGEYSKRLETLEKQIAQDKEESNTAAMEQPMGMMDGTMALPQYAQQGAVGYVDPNMMQQQQQQQQQQQGMMAGMQQPGMMQQQGMMQQPGMY